MLATRTQALSRLLDKATYALAIVAGALLVAMVLTISVAVVARYLIGAPILGVNEIVQLTAVALAMLALPYATSSGAHVRADIFDRLLGRWGRFAGDLTTRALSITVLGVLVARAWAKVLDAFEYGDATNMLGLPIWPFYGLIVLGMGACILVFALQVAAILLSGKAAHD